MSAKKTVFCAMPAVKNRSAEASAYALRCRHRSSPSVRLANCVPMAASTPTLTLCFSASSSASSIFSLIVCRR